MAAAMTATSADLDRAIRIPDRLVAAAAMSVCVQPSVSTSPRCSSISGRTGCRSRSSTGDLAQEACRALMVLGQLPTVSFRRPLCSVTIDVTIPSAGTRQQLTIVDFRADSSIRLTSTSRARRSRRRLRGLSTVSASASMMLVATADALDEDPRLGKECLAHPERSCRHPPAGSTRNARSSNLDSRRNPGPRRRSCRRCFSSYRLHAASRSMPSQGGAEQREDDGRTDRAENVSDGIATGIASEVALRHVGRQTQPVDRVGRKTPSTQKSSANPRRDPRRAHVSPATARPHTAASRQNTPDHNRRTEPAEGHPLPMPRTNCGPTP